MLIPDNLFGRLSGIMNIIVLVTFCAILVFCIVKSISIPYALFCGVLLFAGYAKYLKFSWREIWKMLCSRVNLVKHMFIILSLIGVMTAMWRASGTIQTIVNYAVDLLTPSTFLMMTFLINCAVSFLTGSSFGTAATFGMICMTIGRSLGMNLVALGGAALGGAFFGDRTSPVSSTAIMVSMVTGTDLHSNVRRMLKDAIGPVIISSAIYLAIGLSEAHRGNIEVRTVFGDYFNLNLVLLLPAVIIIVFALLRIKVLVSILTSTGAAFVLAMIYQHETVLDLLRMCIMGYETDATEIASMINGGGFKSMVTCLLMSAFSCTYAGLFEATGLLDPLKVFLRKLSEKVSPYFAVMTGGTAVILLSCSQMLPLMLLGDTAMELETSKENAALDFENSIITIAPLVPWTIANTVPIASIGADTKSTFFAFFLYILPLYSLAVSLIRKCKNKKTQSAQ